MHKGRPSIKRPSRVLGLLICAELLIFGLFIFWQIRLPLGDVRKFTLSQWVVPGGAITAMLGWSISSLVTILNSVKQHTINTLLQSRLSATYMGYADTVNNHFSEFAKKNGLKPEGWNGLNPIDGIDKAALRCIMNYFEFISIAIRHGDLNSKMMRASLASILKNTVIFSDSFISESKKISCELFVILSGYSTSGKRQRGASALRIVFFKRRSFGLLAACAVN